MKNIFLDIGTHKAEEIRVLVGDSYYIAWTYLYWFFDWIKRQIKRIIKYDGLISYGTGAFMRSPFGLSFSEHKLILKQILFPQNLIKEYFLISIDPAVDIAVPHILKIKRTIDTLYLPIAILPHGESADYALSNFYVGENSLSSSLDKSDGSRDKTVVTSVSFQVLLEKLKEELYFKDDVPLVLRYNCEGAELAILQNLLTANLKPKRVMGSINDVLKKYGEKDFYEINQLMKENDIQFTYFKGSDPSTWPEILQYFKGNSYGV